MFDHKKIGVDLDLFIFNKYFKGQVNFLHKGVHMLNNLKKLTKKELLNKNYLELDTGSLGSLELWEKSKHNFKYSENMFKVGNSILKPMNCPIHLQVMQSIYDKKSTLPIKVLEYNCCYRNEDTGSLCGLFRLVKFTQDDSHIVVRLSEVNLILKDFISIVNTVYKKLFDNISITYRLSEPT